MFELKREQQQEEHLDIEPERHQAITKIRFGEPYENTRKHSKHDVGEDLVVAFFEYIKLEYAQVYQ